MKHVLQKHARGCGVAVLAMVTGHDYDAIVDYFKGLDFNRHGLYLRSLEEYLAEHGFAWRSFFRYRGWFIAGHSVPREPWPPKAFAYAHICEVKIEGAPCNHFVVLLEDDTVLDPLTTKKKWLADYAEINNVTGVYRIRPNCSACGSTGVMAGDPCAPADSIRRFDVPCPECRSDA